MGRSTSQPRQSSPIPVPLSSLPLLLLHALLLTPPALSQYQGTLENSTATYYGGLDGAGTIGNAACGYGNLYQAGVGLMNAAASIAMWDSGAICGACFEVSCRISPWCRYGTSVVVTVTNQCPQGSEGGWCDRPHRHLDMAYPAWAKIATDPIAGVVGTYMRRVPCTRQGGVRFRFAGNQWWTQVTVFNVAGSGDVAALDVSTDRGATWQAFERNWGSVWSKSGWLLGKSLSFRLRTGLANEQLVILDAVPATWQLGQEYSTGENFAPPSPSPSPSPSLAPASPPPSPPGVVRPGKTTSPPPRPKGKHKRHSPRSARKPPPPAAKRQSEEREALRSAKKRGVHA